MKVGILESLGITEEHLQTLEEPFKKDGVTFVHYDRTTDEGILSKEVQDLDVAIIANMPFSNDVIRSSNTLKFIDVAFTGVDHVGLDAAKEKGIAVSNASGYSTEAVAELAIGTVISRLRFLKETEALCRDGKNKGTFIGSEIKGKTVGIIGLGKIGMRTAELFHAFGATIIANKKHPTPMPEWLSLKSKEEVLSQSDILILNCPLNDETRGMIDLKALQTMKKTALLVNMARGPVVNEEELAQALKDGVIAGAITDVFASEPPLDTQCAILNAPNTTVTPHIGFATKEAMIIRADIIFANLRAWIDGKQDNIVM